MTSRPTVRVVSDSKSKDVIIKIDGVPSAPNSRSISNAIFSTVNTTPTTTNTVSKAQFIRKSPSLKILILKDREIEFALNHVPLHMLTTLKTMMETEVATMAVTQLRVVETRQDIALLLDMAARLGQLIFISDDARYFNRLSQCDCRSSCVNCSVTFKINVANNLPLGTRRSALPDGKSPIIPITEKDLKPVRGETSVMPWSPSPEDSATIGMLTPQQLIHAEALVRKGTGLDGAQFRPVIRVAIKDVRLMRINRQLEKTHLSVDQRRILVNRCPTGVFELDESTQQVNAVHPQKCTDCGECERFSNMFCKPDSSKPRIDIRPDKYVNISSHPTKYRMFIRTNGALPPLLVVRQALVSYIIRLQQIETAAKSLMEQDMKRLTGIK